jgi:hypothetical protein
MYVCTILQQAKSFAHLVFPNSRKSVDSKDPMQKDEESERGLISCITHGTMSGTVLHPMSSLSAPLKMHDLPHSQSLLCLCRALVV